MVKNLSAMQETPSIPGSGRSPGEGNTPVFLPGEFHGQRRLTGYSPWDHRANITLNHQYYFRT